MKSQFFKSSFSGEPRQGRCVMCRHINKIVEVKHSLNPTKITFTEAEWNAFVKGVKAGEFNL